MRVVWRGSRRGGGALRAVQRSRQTGGVAVMASAGRPTGPTHPKEPYGPAEITQEVSANVEQSSSRLRSKVRVDPGQMQDMAPVRAALRVQEVAAKLGINYETARRAVTRGELPGRKLGA